MLDSAGAAAVVDPKPKANKGSTKSAQRFWPENIAGLQFQPSSSTAEDSGSRVLNYVRVCSCFVVLQCGMIVCNFFLLKTDFWLAYCTKLSQNVESLRKN